MEAKVDQTPATNSNPVLSIDKEGCVLYSNEGGNLLLKEWGVKVGEKLPSSIRDPVQRVAYQNSPEKMEVKAGDKVFLVIFSPLPEQERVNIFGFDISDQKEAEEELKESKERLNALMDHNPSLLFMKDECDRYVYLNSAYEKQFIHSKDWYGKTDFDFWPKESAELFRKNDSIVLKSGKIHQFMEDSTDLSGTRYCWLNYKFPFTDLKNKRYVGGIGFDVTDRVRAEEALQESEERYRMLFTNMTEGFGLAEVIYNSEGKPIDYRYLEVNPAFDRYLGAKREQLLGKTMRETFPNVSPIAIEKYGEVALSGQPINFEIFSKVANKYLDIYAFSPEKGKVAIILRDISERKRLEEQTIQRAEELEAIMDVVPIPILIGHDPQGHNITGNRMANEFYEAEVGDNISASIPKGRRFFYKGRQLSAEELPVQQAALKNIDLRNVELDVLLRSGKQRTTLMSSSPLHNIEGHVRGSVGAFVDITERKKVEAKLKDTLDNLDKLVKERTEELRKAYDFLKKSESNLAEAQEMAHIGSWERSIASNEYRWSDELYRIFGLKPQESTANYDTFLNCVHPDDRNYVNNAVKEALNGKPLDTNFRIIRANGEERIAHAKAEVVFDEKNNPIRIRGTTQDITKRIKAEERLRESEERYRNIVETSNEGIIIIDDEAKVTYANNKMTDMLGYTLEEGIGRPIWDFADEEGKTILKQNLEKRRQGVNESYELKLICKDGSLLWALINAKSLFDKDGKFAGSLSMLTDITKRKKAEEALENLEIARKKEIHHRIKNNLQVISSLLDLQAEQFRNRENIKDLEVLEAFRESQDRVISMALIHEELYKGGGFETLNFSPYIQELADTLFHTYRLGNADISLNIDLEENLLFDMDTAVPLGMIVNEIISNSLKHAFIGRDKGEVRIKLHRDEPTEFESKDCESISTNFNLTIFDNGVGIPENLDIENLDSLGMQLVTSLVEQLDGELEMKRSNGTEFTIRFTVTEKTNK